MNLEVERLSAHQRGCTFCGGARYISSASSQRFFFGAEKSALRSEKVKPRDYASD